MPILASDLTRGLDLLYCAGLPATLALASAAIVVLAYLARAVENYIRHLHHKSYLHFASPRFLIAVAGYRLVADGFLIGAVFDRLPVATITGSAGLILLITSAVLSILPLIRQIREIRETKSAGSNEEKP